nr:helix-turn-helix transcriptional regulator [Catenibacterium mitsuokai]
MSNRSASLRYATYGEIACYLGITRQAVGNKMHGKSQFTLEEVLKLYDVYGVTIWELRDIIEEETKIYKKKKEYGLWKRQK